MIDARPSDAIALALRADCPIFVAEHVMQSAKLSTTGSPMARPPINSAAGSKASTTRTSAATKCSPTQDREALQGNYHRPVILRVTNAS